MDAYYKMGLLLSEGKYIQKDIKHFLRVSIQGDDATKSPRTTGFVLSSL